MPKNSNLKQIKNKAKPRIAIVHDWLYGGGAERVVLELHKLYPEAPIYTSFCSDEWRERLDNKVVTGYLNRQPFRKLYKFLPLLRQIWFSRLDLSQFDLVISSTGNGESKFARVPNGIHISYCFTPVHFYWRHFDEYIKSPGFKPKWLARLGLKLIANPLRKRDYKAAQKVDYFIAISSHIKKDIKKYYDRDSEIIYPPVDIDKFTKANVFNRKGFVTMGRLVPMKKLDLIIEACNQLRVDLTVIGRGPEYENLAKLAGPTITIKTDVSDEEMPEELAKASGFIFASFEDFGIAPIEAMACGTPVLAYGAGGAQDYVKPGVSGEFFDRQSVESIKEAIVSFKPDSYKESEIRESTLQFSSQKFGTGIKQFIDKKLNS